MRPSGGPRRAPDPQPLTHGPPPRLRLERRLPRRGRVLQAAGRGGALGVLLQRPEPLLRLELQHLRRGRARAAHSNRQTEPAASAAGGAKPPSRARRGLAKARFGEGGHRNSC